MSADNGTGPEVERLVRRMAEREATVHLQHPLRAAYVDHPPVRLVVSVEPCHWCGRQAAAQPPFDGLAPTRQVRVQPGAELADDQVGLTALACESLTGRSLLLLCRGAEQGRDLPSRWFVTRAAACARMLRGDQAAGPRDLVARLDRAESWVDGALGGEVPASAPSGPWPPPYPLPAAARLNPEPAAPRPAGWLAPHFLTPHLTGPPVDRWNRAYLRWRADRVAAGLS